MPDKFCGRIFSFRRNTVLFLSLGFISALVFAGITLTRAALSDKASPLSSQHDSGLRVVVSIKPLHSLVSAIMRGVGEPTLLVNGASSPHTYYMTPTEGYALNTAQLVFWIGPKLETFLIKPLQNLPTSAQILRMDTAPGVQRLPLRETPLLLPSSKLESQNADANSDSEHEGEEGEFHTHSAAASRESYDPHIWLSPANARQMISVITAALSAQDPRNASLYEKNRVRLDQDLEKLQQRIHTLIQPLSKKRFVVFHDAYAYFEREFNLQPGLALTLNPQHLPGARRLATLQKAMQEEGVHCIFTEPQFHSKFLDLLMEETKTRHSVLDPLGSTLKNGPDLYIQLIDAMARSFEDCLRDRNAF